MNYVGTFEDRAGRVLEIRQTADYERPFRIRVTLPNRLEQALRSHPDYPFEIAEELKGWLCRDNTLGEHLKVEAGILQIDGAGPTLNLFPISHDELKPEVVMGLYDDWDDDLGLAWAFPLSVYRRHSPPAGADSAYRISKANRE